MGLRHCGEESGIDGEMVLRYEGSQVEVGFEGLNGRLDIFSFLVREDYCSGLRN